MTACSNRKGRAGRVITAALVGALSVGAPMVALATSADASGDVDLMVAGNAQYFSNGKITAVYDDNGYAVSAGSDGAYALGGGISEVVVQPAGDFDAVTVEAGNIEFADAKITDSSKPASSYTYGSDEPSSAGTYWAKAEGTGTYDGGTVYFKVTVAANSLDGVFAYEGDLEDGDTTLTFDFEDQSKDVKFAIGDKKLEKNTDVTATWFDADRNVLTTVKDAGTYTVKVEGVDGSDYEGAVEYLTVTVNKLDLADAGFAAEDVEYTGDAIDVDEPTSDDYPAADSITWKLTGPLSGGVEVIEKGEYTWTGTVDADGDNAKNLTGTATVTFRVAGTLVESSAFEYDGEELSTYSTESGALKLDSSKDKAIDLEKLTVDKGDGTYYKQGEDYTVSFERKDGDKWVATTSYDEAGTYRMTVKMSSDKDLSGTEVAYFKVIDGTMETTDVYVSFEGKAVTSNKIETTYDGKNVVDDVEVSVKVDGKTLVAGTDYKVEFKKDGKVVDEIVDAANDYSLVVTPLTYEGAAEEVSITVEAVKVTGIRVATGDFDGLLYTGSEIDPVFEYSTADNKFSLGDDYKSQTLPSDIVKLSGLQMKVDGEWKSVDSVQEPGDYRVTVSLYGDKTTNYDISNLYTDKTIEFTVLDKLASFEDVASTDWYVGPVNYVMNKQWMTGVGGKLFAPTNQITRAEVACVFANVADFTSDPEAKSTIFDDVIDGAYYTGSVEWAYKAGIVSGYGDGTFGAKDSCTREQFAAMLANYAKAYGLYEAPGTDLSDFDDASEVSAWAEESVAWAVENGILGNGGYIGAKGTITRAEVAAMVMNFAEAFDVE